jgi:signal transduction histidine kinase
MLVGTDAGLGVIAGRRVMRYPDPRTWLAGNVWAIHEDDRGVRWFGTDHGLVRQTESELVRYTTADGLADNRVTALLGGAGGVLWIGTSRGLTRLHDGVFRTYAEREGFIGNHVRALLEDQDALWIGTYDGGLYRLADGRLTRYTTADGLHDNGVFQILDDGLGHVWMGSNRGISRVRRDDLHAFADGRLRTIQSTVFGIKDGLTTLECNGGRQPSGLRMPDGTLWIPTQGGVAIVSPASVRVNPHPPPVRIEDVRMAGASVASWTAGIEVPADRSSFEIDYTALSFVNPDQVRFRYRLAGLEDGWVEAGARRTAAYHRIPPGRYTFEVIAANSDGVWSATGDQVAIAILAPFWRQTWFLASLAVIVAAAGVVIERRRVARFRREHARQQAYARQLLETQERERRRISNELHDSLGQTLFMIRQRARAAGEADAPPEAGETPFGAIAGLATRAYDEMKEIAYNLRPYQLDKIGLTRTIDGMLGRVSRACGLDIAADLDDIDDLFADDAQINVYRIVQEGVSNIVRHAGATEAGVSICRRGRVVVMEIRDNGVGFAPAGDRGAGAGSSFGLTHLLERARVLNGTVEIRSRPGAGTTLVIRLAPEAAVHGA